MSEPDRQRRRLTLGVLSNFQMYDGTLSSYLQPIIRGLKAAAYTFDCNLLLACGVTRHSAAGMSVLRPAWPVIAPDSDFLPVGPWNTDGLLMCPPFRSATRERYVQQLIDTGFPVVCVGHDQGGLVVAPDNISGIRQAMAHLVEHGHRAIAFLGRWKQMQDADVRLQQYKLMLHTYNLPYSPSLIAYGQYNTPGAYRAMQQILSSGAACTAVIACNDEAAIGAMQALREADRRIPQDVALIGFDDRMEAAVQVPPLTTVHFSLYDIGYQSVQLMLDAINGRVRSPHIIHLPTTLIVRQSCGCQSNGWQAISAPDHNLLPSDSLAQMQDTVVQAMLAVLPMNAPTLAAAELTQLCRQLLHDFLQNIGQPDTRIFQAACQEVLYRVEACDLELIPWESVISVLRRWMPHVLACTAYDDLQSRQVADDMLHQGRIAISESTQRRDHRHRLQEALWAKREGILTAHLLATQDELHILTVLEAHLPGLGIQPAQLFFYEADGQDPVAWSRVSAASTPALRFLSRSFPPPGLVSEHVASQWALLPLIFQEESLGFVVFETERLEVCAILRAVKLDNYESCPSQLI